MKSLHLGAIAFLFLILVATFVISQPSSTNNYSSYKKSIQRTFAQEVAGKKSIALVSQSARLLAMLEFMNPVGFPAFEECFKKYRKWGDLSATKREQAVEACKGSAKVAVKKLGRVPAGASPIKPTAGSGSPQIGSLQRSINQLISEIQDLDSRVSSLQDGQRSIQDSIARSSDNSRSEPEPPPFEDDIN